MTATKVLQRRETAQPRTVLAYYGAITGLVLGGVVGAVSTLAATGVSTYLIPWLLGFGALIVVAVLVGVFVVMLKDPSRLMLGQVSDANTPRYSKSDSATACAASVQSSLTLAMANL